MQSSQYMLFVCIYIYVCVCVCVCVSVCVSDHCHHTSQTDECSVSGRNVTHALFLHTLFFQKTKQLPILMKCCEEIQPHQWKPPVGGNNTGFRSG